MTLHFSIWVFTHRLKRVPEVLVWPYYGDTARVFADGERLSIERYERYGPVWSTWLLGKRTTFIGSLDLMKWCMTKEHDVLEGAPSLHSCSWMLESLLGCRSNCWLYGRVSPAPHKVRIWAM